jgi:hypothetical protein
MVAGALCGKNVGWTLNPKPYVVKILVDMDRYIDRYIDRYWLLSYYSVKRDLLLVDMDRYIDRYIDRYWVVILLQCQKRPITVSKETYYWLTWTDTLTDTLTDIGLWSFKGTHCPYSLLFPYICQIHWQILGCYHYWVSSRRHTTACAVKILYVADAVKILCPRRTAVGAL